MAELNTEKRDDLQDRQFAYIDSDGRRHLPIHDESHVKNAIARFSQTHFESESDKKEAAGHILSAARRHGIEVNDSDDVRRAAGH